jgi:hypothetical protein
MLAHNQQGPHRLQSGQLPAVKALHTSSRGCTQLPHVMVVMVEEDLIGAAAVAAAAPFLPLEQNASTTGSSTASGESFG